ncbi:MAG: FimV/HubP family polar landmark protein [Candidatus Thiodiazotropha sp.]
MIRKLSLAVAVATALSPVGALALGLGEIHSHSVLYQDFKAEIDLLSVNQEEIQDIKVNLASQEAFDRAGIERLFLLSDLKFKPIYSASGKPVIAITSNDPIREPFLNFLLEVNWPKGRMVREYTVLLDPPSTLNRAPEQVSAPRVSGAPSREMGSVPMSRAVMPRSSGDMGGREYGPVQPNDNLWSIAKMLRSSDESIEQVMMALQRHNPDAFINNNVNNLKVGKVLRLPEGADVTGLSRQAAREEFLAQTRAWRRGRSPQTPSTAATSTKTEPVDRLKLISPKTDAEGEAMRREGDAEVTRLEQEILLVRESNESALQENDALRTRVQELESQIEDIQRLMTLKSDELSQMQRAQQIASEKMKEAAQQTSLLPTEAEAPVAEPMVAETPTEEPEISTEEQPTATPVPEAADIEQAQTEPLVEEPAQAEQVETAAAPTPMEEPKGPAVAQVVPKPEPIEEPAAAMPEKKVSYFDNLGGNTTLLGIVGAVAVLLIGMLWMIMRRRKEAEAEFAESILVSPDSDIATVGKDERDSLNEPSDETSFMSDFSPSDIDALQDETGEVDPLSEADVYIAYGRYQQAEELIKQAIEKFPNREELKHKLLEIYFSAKKGKEFTKLAEELHGGGLQSSNPDVWSKVASMGKDLNPGHALFAGAAGVAGASLAGDDELEDLGLDLGEEFNEVSKPAAEEDESPNVDLDSMDLSGLDNLDEMDSESLVGDMSLDSEFLDKMESGDESSEEPLEIDLGDLDTATDEVGAAESRNIESTEEAIELGDSESLDNMDLESIERELEGLSEDLDDTAEAESLELPDHEISEDISLDLVSSDEVTTMLDLARAYIDMGDNEGAKGILDEVVNEGTDQQKQDAQELLGNIGS